MNCTNPPELDDRQLLAFNDGEADEGVSAHLARCPYCRSRAGELANLQRGLIAQLYRLTCPPSEELGDYHLGLLSNERRMIVAGHLRECPHCTRELAQVRNYLRELAPPLPANALEGVKVLVARLAGGRQPGRAAEMGALAPAYVLRGGGQGPVTLEADGLLLILDLQPAEGSSLTVLGQLAAEAQEQWTGAAVVLRQGEVERCPTAIDDLGAFRCEGIQPGPLEVRITPVEGPVVMANIEVAG
jgi:anti-sigma factor RsiW